MGEKTLTDRIIHRPQVGSLRMVTEIKAGRILQNQDTSLTLNAVAGGSTLGQ
jgi:hypothetical protein